MAAGHLLEAVVEHLQGAMLSLSWEWVPALLWKRQLVVTLSLSQYLGMAVLSQQLLLMACQAEGACPGEEVGQHQAEVEQHPGKAGEVKWCFQQWPDLQHPHPLVHASPLPRPALRQLLAVSVAEEVRQAGAEGPRRAAVEEASLPT